MSQRHTVLLAAFDQKPKEEQDRILVFLGVDPNNLLEVERREGGKKAKAMTTA